MHATTGAVWCWGSNKYGQMGSFPNATRVYAPQQVDGLSDVVKIVAGTAHSCGLKKNGTVACWGHNGYGQFGVGHTYLSQAPEMVLDLSGVKDLASGARHMCALSQGGDVDCWGSNDSGQVGTGAETLLYSRKQRVLGLPKAVGIVAASAHTCAWTADNVVYCWGFNHAGQLGTGDDTPRRVPTRVLQNW